MRVEPIYGVGRKVREAAQRFHVAIALVFIGLFAFAPFCRSETALPVYEVKSAFLYNFAKFIQWPPRSFPTPDAPLVIGVIGHNPFGDYLTELQGRKIGNHSIQIEHFESTADVRDGHCQILFIGDRKRVSKLITELHNADILTITDEVDTDSFQSTGAVINLVTTANRTVHFEINVDAARRAELKINSSLLNLAKIVRDGRA